MIFFLNGAYYFAGDLVESSVCDRLDYYSVPQSPPPLNYSKFPVSRLDKKMLNELVLISVTYSFNTVFLPSSVVTAA